MIIKILSTLFTISVCLALLCFCPNADLVQAFFLGRKKWNHIMKSAIFIPNTKRKQLSVFCPGKLMQSKRVMNDPLCQIDTTSEDLFWFVSIWKVIHAQMNVQTYRQMILQTANIWVVSACRECGSAEWIKNIFLCDEIICMQLSCKTHYLDWFFQNCQSWWNQSLFMSIAAKYNLNVIADNSDFSLRLMTLPFSFFYELQHDNRSIKFFILSKI